MVPAPAGAATEAPAAGAWPETIIDRPLTLPKGFIVPYGDLDLAYISLGDSSATSVGLQVGAGYAVSDQLTVGADYAFSLKDFEIKGDLRLYGAFRAIHAGKLSVAIGAGLDIDLNSTSVDTTGATSSSTTEAIFVGAAARFNLAPKIALYTGNNTASGPSGHHLTISLNEGQSTSLAIPVGVAFQASPQLFAFAETNIATIAIHNAGDTTTIGDFTPLTVGAIFNVSKMLEVGGFLNFPDLQHAGDFFVIGVNARYYLAPKG